MAFIYKITNIKNNKYYIGSTSNFKKRKYQHTYELCNHKHHNRLLQKDWDYYGEENFEFIILETIPDDCKLQREQEYLDSLIGKENEIYNICSDCQGGSAMSFRPRMVKCKICKKHFDTYDLTEKVCSFDCEMIYETFKDEYNHPENYRWKRSNYERKHINNWDVDDFTAADWDDRMSK